MYLGRRRAYGIACRCRDRGDSQPEVRLPSRGSLGEIAGPPKSGHNGSAFHRRARRAQWDVARRHHPSAERSYKLAISHLTAVFGKRLLCDISGAEVAEYQKACQRDGVASHRFILCDARREWNMSKTTLAVGILGKTTLT